MADTEGKMITMKNFRFDIWWSQEDDCWVTRVNGPSDEYALVSGHGSSPKSALHECLVALDSAIGPWVDGPVCESCGNRYGEDAMKARSAAMRQGTCLICGAEAFVLDAHEFGGVRHPKVPETKPDPPMHRP